MKNRREKVELYDHDLDIYGVPKWFCFIIKGGRIVMENAEPITEGESAEFDWPIPQTIRLSYYAKKFAREEED